MPAKASARESTERVMIFIDGSNLYHVLAQNCGRYDLVFDKFGNKLADGRRLVRTYYYNIRQDPTFNPSASAEQERFLSALFEIPYFEVRLGVHRRHGDQMVEKGVDVMMATDIVVGAFRDIYDTAIVVSGDGDFYPAMQVAKDLGKHIEVVAFDSNLSPEAKRVADSATLLKKTFFTGLWTTRSRAATAKTDEDENKPATGRRPTRAKTSAPDDQGSVPASGTDGDKPSRRTPSRRRRPVRTAAGSNGVSADTPQAGDSESTESPTTPETPATSETQETRESEAATPSRRPVRRRRMPSRRESSAGETTVPEPANPTSPANSGDAAGSDKGASENGASSDSSNDKDSGGGSWWSRRRSGSSD
ncbi:MAG: NYN domain-containing protein [Chloroflexi bacterium]|nr:NYN domain-containing protein [Chloroflexota bacterium]